MGMFDDLIPTKTSGGMFDDLIPAKPTPQQIEAAVVKPPTEAELKAAEKPAIITKQLMPSKAKIEEATKKSLETTIPFEDLYKNPELFGVIKDYMKVSRNVVPEKGQTDEDFVKKYMATMRDVEFNTFFGALPELNRIKNAKPEDAQTLGLGRELYKQTRSVFQPGGQGYGSADALVPYWNAMTSIATDPLNYVGFVGGKIGGQVVKLTAAQEAAQLAAGAAAKGKLASLLTPTKGKVVAGVAGLETASGAGQSVVSQRLDQEVAKSIGQEPEELSAPQMILSGVVSGLFGGLEAKAAVTKFGKKYGLAEELEKLKKSKKKTPTDPTAPPTKVETALLSPVDENMDLLAEEFMKQEGAKILDEISPAAALVEPAIRRDLSQRAIRVAMNVIENDPSYKVKAGQKTSTAIAEVFSAMDQGLIDDTLLEQAIRKEGLSPEQFAQANRVTVTQAAQIMQQYSTASKALNRLRQIDPDVAKQVDALYGKPDEYTSTLGYLGGAFNRLERESKALIVSGIGTTVRNVMGSGIGLTFNSAASVIEGSLMTIGKTLAPEAKGARLNTLKTSIGDTIENAFGTWGYLRKNDLASEVTDELLKHNPSIRSHILSAMQESDTDLSKIARMANALNIAQDAFFRKAIFANSVEKKLKGVGLDMYQLIADGKVIPADILKEAADETLKATFSYTPKIPKGGIKTFEGGAEAMGNYFVKAAEVPGGSLFVTFPRFMTNAIAFQYRYSPLGGISGAEDILRGSKMLANGDETGAALIRKGQENTAKGIVGTSALLAAIDYRENNQDVEWNMWKRDDGTTVDMRGIFPIGPLLAMADVSVKQKRGLSAKTGDAFEAVIGMKMPSGTQNQFMDQLISALSSERDVEKWADKMGKVIGDFGARFVSPFIVKDIFNLVDLIREGGSVARDPNVLKSEKPTDRILEAAGNRIQSKLPVLKEELPETIPRVRQGPIYKEGEFFNNLVGIRITPEKTPEETELIYLGIETYKLFGQPSGDKEYDRAYVEEANPLVIATIQRAMLSPRYQSLPEIEQKQAIENVVKNILPVARQLTDAKFMQEDLNRVYKMKFNKLTEDTRKIINNRYAAENNGKTLEETNDYMRVPEYAAKIKDLQFSKGGFLAGKIATAGAKGAVTGGTEGMLNLIRKVKNPEAIVANEINNVVEDALNKADLTTKAIPTKPVAKVKSTSSPVTPTPPVEEAVPITKQMEEAIPETIPAKIEEPLPEIKTELPEEVPSIYTTPVATINLNKPKYGSDPDFVSDEAVRKSTLSSIKLLRQESFAAVKDAPEFAGIDPSAIAVAQGEYRAKIGREFNADSPTDVTAFAEFAQGYQKKLEDLREQYKDMPPKILIHGTETERTPAKVKRGFFDPQTIGSKKHMELEVGATSFTSDLRLNYRDDAFGGPVVKNISYTEIPYADYMFRRVDMPLSAYTKKDMNTIARAITGDPTVARPLSLPRNLGYRETEDAFVESEKLKIQTDFNKIEKQYKLIEQQETNRKRLTNKLLDVVNKTDKDGLTLIDNIKASTEKPKEVYETYITIKGLFKNEFRHTGSAASSKAGMLPTPDSNQTFISSLNKLAKTTTVDTIDAVSLSLERSGAKDKALALKQLSKNLKTIQTVPMYIPSGSTPADIADMIATQTKAANNIRDLIGNDFKIVDPANPSNTKRIGLAKGGLASRR
jgi:hypothetical protein